MDKEELALLVQFVTGTSKVPLEGFKALQARTPPLSSLPTAQAAHAHPPASATWIAFEEGQIHLSKCAQAALQ